ncbi:MAG: exopolysaccharide biosynthesis polyprenyl glycosylphosphotransferase [Deltaproteobacteria bacterium]|nr:exopolysaccharide biosynthesis polyprenyl glycosylphosphotransferase [Deltaproteobacteria bacterium]
MSAAPKHAQLMESGRPGSALASNVSVVCRCLTSRAALILATESAWLAGSGVVLVRLSHELTEQPTDWWRLLNQVTVVVLVYAIAFYLMDLYDVELVASRRALTLNLTQALGLVFIALGLLERCFDGLELPLKLVLLHAALTAAFVIAARTAIERLIRTRWRLVSIGFIGHAAAQAELKKYENALAWLGFNLQFVGDSLRPAREELRIFERHARIHRLVIEEACLAEARAASFLQECMHGRIKVEKLSLFWERAFGKLRLGQHPFDDLAFSDGRPLAVANSALRRLLDVVLAWLGLVITLPLTLVIAVAIKCDSCGPVFFMQDRVGKNGRCFKMIKFRSMYLEESRQRRSPHGPEWTTSKCDPRITRVGGVLRGFHLDELPQLINVLKGDMSIVGPRPFHPLHSAQLEKIPGFNLRLVVLPGITGWAQVRCDYSDSVENGEEVLAHDLYYVKHASVIFDLMIIIETIRICLWRRGAR